MSQILPPDRLSPHHGRLIRRGGLGLAILLALIAAGGLYGRHHAFTKLAAATEAQAIPTVLTVKPMAGPPHAELVLPANVQALAEAPIYARTSGYLAAWHADIGAVVKKGQLLAEIDTPEIDAQLRQAQADLATAEANAAIARSTAERYQALVRSDSVSRQDADEKAADAAAKTAALAAAKANLARLSQLEGFKRVVAPFDGVITARRTDVGTLINAGAGAGAELFRLTDRSTLRVYVQVPQLQAAFVKDGMAANLRFAEQPGRGFPARLVRTADAIDPVSRSLLAEFHIDNGDGSLRPGSYAEAHLMLPTPVTTLRLPGNTLLFQADGLRVAKVDAQSRVTLAPVELGRDFGNEVEVVAGVAASDEVVLNPPDSLTTGQTIRVAAAKPGLAQ